MTYLAETEERVKTVLIRFKRFKRSVKYRYWKVIFRTNDPAYSIIDTIDTKIFIGKNVLVHYTSTAYSSLLRVDVKVKFIDNNDETLDIVNQVLDEIEELCEKWDEQNLIEQQRKIDKQKQKMLEYVSEPRPLHRFCKRLGSLFVRNKI